ncbi:MAG: HTH domain-containing protein [Candidatus Spechtbacterales bacterium]
MTPILLFIIVVVLIVVVAFAFAKREAGRHGTKTREELVGICKAAIETASQKEVRKHAALALLRERGASDSAQGKGVLSNAEIRSALGVSGRTVVRYMDELEAEGKVEQVGKVGHAVTYRLR